MYAAFKPMIRPLALAAAIGIGALLQSASPASAFFGSHHTGPAACAPHSGRFDVPGLWLGHFSGGRRAYHANGDMRVDWRSEYQCFFSARECYAWRASLRREYARYQGYGTCLALRGGGRPVRYIARGISARY